MESGVKYILQFVFALLVISVFFEYKASIYHRPTVNCSILRPGSPDDPSLNP
jgi:hypothetical protein